MQVIDASGKVELMFIEDRAAAIVRNPIQHPPGRTSRPKIETLVSVVDVYINSVQIHFGMWYDIGWMGLFFAESSFRLIMQSRLLWAMILCFS